MVFSSAIFLLLFLPVTFLINLILSFTGKMVISNLFLLLASLFFYAWGEPVLVLVMIFIIVLNWLMGLLIARFKDKKAQKIALLVIAVASDLSVLFYFKYAGFLTGIINDMAGAEIFAISAITLPIGISFFTFQAISYIVDVFRGDTAPAKNFINTALYISFFPQLIAGPIVKYREINEQIAQRQITTYHVAAGFRRFIYGLAKKMLISNVMGLCVDRIYALDPALLDPATAWIGALCYTFQIYYDFSGYSDMAIGLGEMFGFIIPENFRYPYLSGSITEFWKRWHISLGSWFREYVYIPLGGNRKGRARTLFNLIIVFFLTGLWHGAEFTFIIWGLFHGAFMLIERVGFKRLLDKIRVINVIYCFFIVNTGFVFFRAQNMAQASSFLGRMLSPWRYEGMESVAFEYFDPKTILIFVLAIAGMGFIQLLGRIEFMKKWKHSIPEAICCTGLLILCLASMAGDTYNPFIYFQF